MQELVTEYCWGAGLVAARARRRERSLINIGMLTALNRSHELGVHVRGAITNGVHARGDPGDAPAGGDLLRRAGGDGGVPHRRGDAIALGVIEPRPAEPSKA